MIAEMTPSTARRLPEEEVSVARSILVPKNPLLIERMRVRAA